MAGREFRFGTATTYMTAYCHSGPPNYKLNLHIHDYTTVPGNFGLKAVSRPSARLHRPKTTSPRSTPRGRPAPPVVAVRPFVLHSQGGTRDDEEARPGVAPGSAVAVPPSDRAHVVQAIPRGGVNGDAGIPLRRGVPRSAGDDRRHRPAAGR